MLRVSRQLRQSVPRFVLEFARRDVAAIYVLFGGAPLYLASLSNNATVMVVSSTVGPLIGIGFLLVRPFNPYWSLGARMEGKEGADSRAGATTARRVAEMLQSTTAKRLTVRTGLFACVGVLAVTGGVGWAKGAALGWSVELWPSTVTSLFWALWSLGPQYHVLMRWLILNWEAGDEGTV